MKPKCPHGSPWNPFAPLPACCLWWLSDMRRLFRENVRIGKYASDGYTVEERAAKEQRRQLSLFGVADV